MTQKEMEERGIKTRYDWRTRNREKFLSDVKSLCSGHSIQKPKQDFDLEQPSGKTEKVEPKSLL